MSNAPGKAIIPLILMAIVLSVGVCRVKSSGDSGLGSFSPYRVVQREDRIYDDGRSVRLVSLEIFTASDGTIRQIRTKLNPDGSTASIEEQLLSPSLGGLLINRQARSYRRFHAANGPSRRMTAREN